MKFNTPIIQVIAHYPPYLGGMENCAEKIAQILADRGNKVTVLSSDQKYTNKYKDQKNMKVFRLKSIEIAHTPIIFSLLPKLLKSPKGSLIHIHISQAFVPEMVYLASKLTHFKYIAHFHLDVDTSGKFGVLLKPYKKHILSRVLRNANQVICLSEEQKRFLVRNYKINSNKISIVTNGVGKEFFLKPTNQKNKVPHLLFVGRLSAQKNIQLLVKTVAKVKMPVILDIIGEGEDEKDLEDLISKLDLKNVVLHGGKTGKQLINFYKNSDAFLISSQKEGISLALLEAMAAGLPIVGVDTMGIRELIKGTGVLVKNPDPKSFSQEIEKLLVDTKKMKELSKKSKEKAKKYTWENTVNLIEKVYQKALYDY